MTDETPTTPDLEPGLRVHIIDGFYEGRYGEVVREWTDGRWYVRLDDHAKMALVHPDEMEIVTQ